MSAMGRKQHSAPVGAVGHGPDADPWLRYKRIISCMHLLVPLLVVALAAPAFGAGPAKKEIRGDAPMSTKMKKPGMKQGDVKKDAKAKAREMKPMLDKESQSMEKSAPSNSAVH